MNSGRCDPRTPPPMGADRLPSSMAGGKGRTPNALSLIHI